MLETVKLGHTTDDGVIKIENESISIDEIVSAWQKPLESVYPTKSKYEDAGMKKFDCSERNISVPAVKVARPKMFIPAFPGTNCEYDFARAFRKSGSGS